MPTPATDKMYLTELVTLNEAVLTRVGQIIDEFDPVTGVRLHPEKIATCRNLRVAPIRIGESRRGIVPVELASGQQAHHRRLATEKIPERPHRRRFRDLRSSAHSAPLPYVKGP